MNRKTAAAQVLLERVKFEQDVFRQSGFKKSIKTQKNFDLAIIHRYHKCFIV